MPNGDPTRAATNSSHRWPDFVARGAGCTVGELLGLLEVTKQSLNRPLRDWIDGGWVRPRSDRRDGRFRRLAGEILAPGRIQSIL